MDFDDFGAQKGAAHPTGIKIKVFSGQGAPRLVGCAAVGRVRSDVERTNNGWEGYMVRRKALRTLQR